MSKKLTFILILFTFIVGLMLGSLIFPRTQYKTVYEKVPTLEDFPHFLKALSMEGFTLENRSSIVTVWITTGTFWKFVEVAEVYKIETIYYSENIYGNPYFWFDIPLKNAIVRWDIP